MRDYTLHLLVRRNYTPFGNEKLHFTSFVNEELHFTPHITLIFLQVPDQDQGGGVRVQGRQAYLHALQPARRVSVPQSYFFF